MGKILLVENINSSYYYAIPTKGVFPGTKCVASDEVTTYTTRPTGTVYVYQGPSGPSYAKQAVILNYFQNPPAPPTTTYTYSCIFSFRNNTGQGVGVVIPYSCYGKSSTCMMTASNGGSTTVTISFTSTTSLSSSNLGITFQQPYSSSNSATKFKIGSTTSSTTTTYSLSNCFKTSNPSTYNVYINK